MMLRFVASCFLLFAACLMNASVATAQLTRDDVSDAMHRAVRFFRQHASAGGGYVYQVSADLSQREGEGRVGPSTAWIEPPATPSVGMAYLNAYQRCGDPLLRDAAKETANALIRGQLRSGGWDNKIEFDPEQRKRYSYRVDAAVDGKRQNTTTFDDDKSQSVIRFLMRLDQELSYQDETLHECVIYALDGALKSQYANGGWPQRYSDLSNLQESKPRRASLPEQWSRVYERTSYAEHYTLNDNTLGDLITTMLDAFEVYGDSRYLESAIRGGDFLIRAQLPEPQPAWAQQYDRDMHPAWARKFEPPAISGGESQGAMLTLMTLYRRTAAVTDSADRFLEPIPRALAYLRRSTLEDGRLARFYEMETNRPLYFTKQYELVYRPNDLPTHYGFIVKSRLDSIEQKYERIRETPTADLWPDQSRQSLDRSQNHRSKKLDDTVKLLVDRLDHRGAWVEPGRLRYGGDDSVTQVIRSDTFSKNLQTLAAWLAAE